MYTLIFLTEDGCVITLASDTPFSSFDNKILFAQMESKEAYAERIKWMAEKALV